MKARIVRVIVTPDVVIDNGVDLVPRQVQPMTVLWRDWPQFAAHGLQDALEQLQEQLDAQQSQTPAAPGDAPMSESGAA